MPCHLPLDVPMAHLFKMLFLVSSIPVAHLPPFPFFDRLGEPFSHTGSLTGTTRGTQPTVHGCRSNDGQNQTSSRDVFPSLPGHLAHSLPVLPTLPRLSVCQPTYKSGQGPQICHPRSSEWNFSHNSSLSVHLITSKEFSTSI